MKLKKVVDEYISSRHFKGLSHSTKRQYGYGLETLDKLFGDRDIDAVSRREMTKVYEGMMDKPGAATQFGRVASAFFSYALDQEYVEANPVARLKPVKGGHLKKWPQSDVEKVIALGDRTVSTAVALAWYTGQRQGDILNWKWDNIEDGVIHFTQEKTGVEMYIPLHPRLAEILRSVPRDGVYIVSGKKPMTTAAFRMMFKRRTRGIGIDLPFHGLRKTVAAELAEEGASTNQIAALLGHKTLAMVDLYTKEANKKRMAADAVSVLVRN